MVRKVECRECGGKIEIPDDVLPGEILSCPDCGVEYEVASVEGDKVELKLAEEVREDWGE